MNPPAATCLELMRSRFSAFRQRNSRYLLETWHKSTRPTVGELESHWSRWVSLRIDDTAKGQVNDTDGTVHFTAFYLDGEYLRSFTEMSRFVRVDDQWRYVDGVVNLDGTSDRKISRNEPCVCGSGKKFKKCCSL